MLTVVKSEQHQGRYFVALGYDHRPLAQRLAALTWQPADNKTLLHQSPLLQPLQQQLGYPPQLQLQSSQRTYFISNGQQQVVLRQNELIQLFPDVTSQSLQLTLQPQLPDYPPEMLFQLQIESRQAGYLSYLQLLSEGATVALRKNYPVEANQQLIYPNPEQFDGLITELRPEQRSDTVSHWLLLCPEPRNLTPFEPISTRKGERYHSHHLDKLLILAEGCEVTIQQQRIQRGARQKMVREDLK
ncbi:hypothetical protein D5085_09745 [Ectothiorhodospiraceae bacterium BW-2]|nr:hypothetical protein D5085_09745 [Ectothiorhodospiraceae bacterium BW-2]